MLIPILLVAAFVLLLLAAFSVNAGRVQLGWLGLALAVFALGVWPALH